MSMVSEAVWPLLGVCGGGAAMTDAEILEEALERLRYGARRGQWATELTAEMCRVVVETIDYLKFYRFVKDAGGEPVYVASTGCQITEGKEDL